MCGGVFGIKGDVEGSLVVLAVERSFLYSFLRGVSYGGGGGGWWCLVVLAVECSSLCVSCEVWVGLFGCVGSGEVVSV